MIKRWVLLSKGRQVTLLQVLQPPKNHAVNIVMPIQHRVAGLSQRRGGLVLTGAEFVESQPLPVHLISNNHLELFYREHRGIQLDRRNDDPVGHEDFLLSIRACGLFHLCCGYRRSRPSDAGTRVMDPNPPARFRMALPAAVPEQDRVETPVLPNLPPR